jgi:alpha-1,2-glucosyltransferase
MQLVSLILTALPHLIVLVAFAAFILINGSVVLGDKTNHVATINLPQMLYIWPYFVFFSWPLVLPQFLRIPAGILSLFSSSLSSRLPAGYKNSAPQIGAIIVFTLLSLAIVHFNTIVHPFMLADNRHYTFYIFKRLLRPWWMRYAATPLYVVCGWACIEMRGNPGTETRGAIEDTKRKTSNTRMPKEESTSTTQLISIPDGVRPATTSFVLIWLLTTALQLSTAPLFEPRYLIIPWLFWRIHLPLQTSSIPSSATSAATSPRDKTKIKLKADPGFLQAILASYDFRLMAETVWYLLINAVTGYIFVTWTFEWPLQPGEKQRFMW